MYSDNTLTPREAIRLCALGTLGDGPMRYEALVTAIRHFVSRISGPSLDLMGESIELLSYEGLVELSQTGADPGEAMVEISQAGREMLKTLLLTNLRAGASSLNELIMALKFHFLHVLAPNEQKAQLELFMEAAESDLARIEDLRRHHEKDRGFLPGWLEHDMDLLEARLAWLKEFHARTFGDEDKAVG